MGTRIIYLPELPFNFKATNSRSLRRLIRTRAIRTYYEIRHDCNGNIILQFSSGPVTRKLYRGTKSLSVHWDDNISTNESCYEDVLNINLKSRSAFDQIKLPTGAIRRTLNRVKVARKRTVDLVINTNEIPSNK